MNVKTIDPKLVYLHVDNCVDLQKIYNEFDKILDEYPDETVISNIHEHCKHKCDSIYNEVEFYTDLEKDTVRIKTNTDGGTTKFKNDYPIIGRLYNELQSGEYLVLDSLGNPQYRNNYTEVLVQVSKFDKNQIINDRQIWKKINFTPDEVKGLSKKTGLRSLSTWFIMFWLEKFRTSSDLVRSQVHSNLSNSEFYREFSESIGCIKNIEFIKQTHTTTRDSSGDIPYPYVGTLNYIMPDREKRTSLELSKKTHSIFFNNITNLAMDYDTGEVTTSYNNNHGSSIRPDVEHYQAMSITVPKIHTTLQQELQKMYDVLMFISNNSNAQKNPKIVYSKFIENEMVDVDMLKNKVKKIQSSIRSNNLLGVV